MKKLFSFLSRVSIVPRGTFDINFWTIPISLNFYKGCDEDSKIGYVIQLNFLTLHVALLFCKKRVLANDETFDNL